MSNTDAANDPRLNGLEDRMRQIEHILDNSRNATGDSKLANENEDLRVQLATAEERLADMERELAAVKKELSRRDYRIGILTRNLDVSLKACDDNKVEVPLV